MSEKILLERGDVILINKNDENYVYYLVAKNLKKQRKTKGLTQHKFAEVLNIDIREFFKPIDEEDN